MWMLVNWTMLAMATLIAGAAAAGVYWLLLRVTLAMMQPATIRPATLRPAPVQAELTRGSAGLARAFTPGRSGEILSLKIQERSK